MRITRHLVSFFLKENDCVVDRHETIDLSGFKGNGKAHIYRTSQNENFERIKHFALENSRTFEFTANAVSINTIYIEVEQITENLELKI